MSLQSCSSPTTELGGEAVLASTVLLGNMCLTTNLVLDKETIYFGELLVLVLQSFLKIEKSSENIENIWNESHNVMSYIIMIWSTLLTLETSTMLWSHFLCCSKENVLVFLLYFLVYLNLDYAFLGGWFSVVYVVSGWLFSYIKHCASSQPYYLGYEIFVPPSPSFLYFTMDLLC